MSADDIPSPSNCRDSVTLSKNVVLLALTSLPDYQHIPFSFSDFLERSACCGFSAGSSLKPSLQTCQEDKTHGRIGTRKKKEEKGK